MILFFNRLKSRLSENKCPHAHCKANYFEEELSGKGKNRKYKTCCEGGKIEFPFIQLSEYPDDKIFCLFTGNSREARLFQKNIRKYNTSLAFASVTSKLAEFKTHGPPVVVVEGNIQHRISSLQKPADKVAAFMQCYFYEEGGQDNAHFKFNNEEVDS